MTKKIIFYVTAVHLLIMFFYHTNSSSPKKSNNKLVVKNYKFKKKAPAKKTLAKVFKKPTAKLEKNPQKKSTPRRKIENKLIDELSKQIATMTDVSYKPTKPLSIPKTVPKLSIVSNSDNSEQQNYKLSLSEHLQKKLSLPEVGAVKLSITVKNNGSISSVSVITFENEKNADYLKNTLRTLSLPCFNGSEEQTFLVMFKNE